MTRLLCALATLSLLACADEVAVDEPDATVDTDSSTSSGLSACDQPLKSACSDRSSVIRGQVTLGGGLTASTGDLFVALVHEVIGGADGGAYHTSVAVQGVDLSEPVPFALDMCAGGRMWSEENCEYSLQVILDLNGNQGPLNLLPDPGEPAHRVKGIWLSCAEASPCLDVVLDCDSGADCATFDDLSDCACDATSCDSEFGLCSL